MNSKRRIFAADLRDKPYGLYADWKRRRGRGRGRGRVRFFVHGKPGRGESQEPYVSG